jgi:hypothetical protein
LLLEVEDDEKPRPLPAPRPEPPARDDDAAMNPLFGYVADELAEGGSSS